jgi:hypothetical protein
MLQNCPKGRDWVLGRVRVSHDIPLKHALFEKVNLNDSKNEKNGDASMLTHGNKGNAHHPILFD